MLAQCMLNLGTIMGVSGWLQDQANLPRGRNTGTIASVATSCRHRVLIGCGRSGDPDHKLVL
jgi:hypothetical protein